MAFSTAVTEVQAVEEDEPWAAIFCPYPPPPSVLLRISPATSEDARF